jgi:capsular exopolysaccharide synthesis family protein
MSIVESAMEKARLAGDTPPKLSTHPRRRAARRSVGEEAAHPPREYQHAATDMKTMERNCILLQIQDQAARRAYKILRTRVLQRLATNQWHSLAVTGTDSGQGKTLTAINLAIALAQDPNTSVFLVDLDLQRPQVASYLGMRYERGLSDYLVGTAQIEQIIYSPGVPRLAIIPSAEPLEHSSDFLAAPRMLELVRVLEEEAPRHVIVYDMPPLLMSDDVLTFVPSVDGVLLVVSEGVTARRALEKSKEFLDEMNVIGVVLNRSAERNDSSYY